ncbi:MAG: FGGY family carbohydrate kinase, partial [Candidatus Cryptobacteroides sp.]
WILDNVPDARKFAQEGRLLFGTVDSYLVWKLTGGKVHVTDVTNASRTMLFNIHTMEWDRDLLDLMDIPGCMLPQVKSCSEIYGYADVCRARIPVAGLIGDQQSALFGQLCIGEGAIKNTYGTGCFLLMNTGTKAVGSSNRLLTTVAWKIGREVNYALEGSVFVAGAAIQWLRDNLGIIRSSAEIETLASQVPDSGGVRFVPALTGLGAPYWDSSARGSITGLSRGTTAAHIARAALDGIACSVADVVRSMQRDSGLPISQIKVDGGACANNLLMQIQADVLGISVLRPQERETTALGACYMAGLATGFWSGTDELTDRWRLDRRFESRSTEEEREATARGWQRAVRSAMSE